jgi:hypothetical protein
VPRWGILPGDAIARAKAAEDRVAAHEKKLEDQAKERQEKANTQAVDGMIAGVANTIKANRKEWPYTNLVLSDDEVRSYLRKTHEVGVQRGETYTMNDLRSSFERIAKVRYQKMSEAAKELLAESAPANGQAIGSPPVSGPPGKGLRQAAPVKNASAPIAAPKQPKTRTLTREQQKQADIAALRAAMAKDKAARAPTVSKAKH